MQPETRFKMRVVDKLKELPNVHVIKIQQVVKRGDPDIVMCVAGLFVAWELKVNKNKATPLQKHQLDLITKAGGLACVVTPDNFHQQLALLCELGVSRFK